MDTKVKVLRITEGIAYGILIGAAGLLVLAMTGCTAVTHPVTGEVIIGFPVARLTETANQVALQGLGQIPVVGSFLQNSLMGVIAGGGSVAGIARVIRNKIVKTETEKLAEKEAARKKADRAREDAERKLALAEAKAEKESNA